MEVSMNRAAQRGMPGLAAALGVAEVAVKLEAGRFAPGSFKALGPPYALARVLGIGAESRVLAIACEGVTDRAVFEGLLAGG